MAKVFNNRILLFIIAVLLISNIGMLIFWYKITGHDHKPRNVDMGWSPMSTFLEKKIGFSKEQMVEFEKIRSEHRMKLKPMFDDIKLAKTNFYKLLPGEALSDAAVDKEAMKISVKQKALDLQTYRNFRQIRSMCTDQQRPIYDSLIPSMISDMWFPNRRGGMSKPGNGAPIKATP